jgi:hypothetical protein
MYQECEPAVLTIRAPPILHISLCHESGPHPQHMVTGIKTLGETPKDGAPWGFHFIGAGWFQHRRMQFSHRHTCAITAAFFMPNRVGRSRPHGSSLLVGGNRDVHCVHITNRVICPICYADECVYSDKTADNTACVTPLCHITV